MKKLLMLAVLTASFTLLAVPVTSVAIRDNKGNVLQSTDATSHCEVKVGDEYDPTVCQRDVRALRDSREFADIKAEAVHTADGMAITYVVTRKPRYQGPLNVIGADYWSESKISGFADLQDGFAYGDSDFAAAANRIIREYHKKHFADVKVTWKAEPVPESDGFVTVTMTIEEGARIKVSGYSFEGNENVDGDELRASFGQFPWWNPLGWFSDDPVSEQDLHEACDKIVEVYRNRGYLDAVVTMPTKLVSDDEESCEFVFKIEEGPCYTVEGIAVVGTKNYPAQAVATANTLVKVGDPAGQDTLEKAAHQIEVYCSSGNNPLAETHVEVRKEPTSSNTVNIVFAVTEGMPVIIDRVLIRGNDYTKDKVLRREISLSPGDRMMGDKAEQSKRRLENLRYFERVRYYLEKPEFAGMPKEGETQHRDLVYEVAEKSTGQFMVGIGASSVDSVYGTIELSEYNFDLFRPWRFRGGGQRGRIGLQAGPRVQTYEASITEPYFLDRVLELTVEGYRRQRWYDDYDAIRNGAGVTVSYPVKFWPTWRTTGRLGFRLAADFVQMDDVSDESFFLGDKQGFKGHAPGSYGRVFQWQDEAYGDSWEVPLRVFWQDDTRDNFLIPTRGHKATIYGEIAVGDNNYWKIGFNYRKYWNVWKRFNHVFMFGIRGDTIDAFSDELPIYDRLFLGGPRSIRGVEYREIAPRVWRGFGKSGDYAPWGGRTDWVVNMEYSIPVVKFVRVAAFTDFGSVGEDSFDFSTDYFCWSGGLGLRLDLESFPIRLDFAFPFTKPKDGVDDQVFSFSVGYDF